MKRSETVGMSFYPIVYYLYCTCPYMLFSFFLSFFTESYAYMHIWKVSRSQIVSINNHAVHISAIMNQISLRDRIINCILNQTLCYVSQFFQLPYSLIKNIIIIILSIIIIIIKENQIELSLPLLGLGSGMFVYLDTRKKKTQLMCFDNVIAFTDYKKERKKEKKQTQRKLLNFFFKSVWIGFLFLIVKDKKKLHLYVCIACPKLE